MSVGVQPYDATFAYGAAWATSYSGGDVERIDPARNKVVKRFPLPSATGVVGAFGSIWAAGQDGVIRIDPATDRVVATIPIAGGAGWTAASANAVWVTTTTGVARIDPATNQVVAHDRARHACARRPRRRRRQALGAEDPGERRSR